MTPGRRGIDQRPAPVVSPDLPKLPYKMKDGVKAFHLVAQVVRRRFMPGDAAWEHNGGLHLAFPQDRNNTQDQEQKGDTAGLPRFAASGPPNLGQSRFALLEIIDSTHSPP